MHKCVQHIFTVKQIMSTCKGRLWDLHFFSYAAAVWSSRSVFCRTNILDLAGYVQWSLEWLLHCTGGKCTSKGS